MLENKKQELLREKHRYNLPLEISEEELIKLNKSIPIQKIIGFVILDDMKFDVRHKVLIPRYETLELINKTLEFINENSKVLDLGCGSGFIGLTIAKKMKCKVDLVDIDSEAILQTKYNAKINQIENINIIQSNLFDKVNNKYDVIVSNPPYIPKDIELDESVLKNEPYNALYADDQGNEYYKKIIKKSPEFLNPGGKIIFEISPWNLNYFNSLNNCQIFKDINNKERIAIISFNR